MGEANIWTMRALLAPAAGAVSSQCFQTPFAHASFWPPTHSHCPGLQVSSPQPHGDLREPCLAREEVFPEASAAREREGCRGSGTWKAGQGKGKDVRSPLRQLGAGRGTGLEAFCQHLPGDLGPICSPVSPRVKMEESLSTLLKITCPTLSCSFLPVFLSRQVSPSETLCHLH